jgi:hypothetical protein
MRHGLTPSCRHGLFFDTEDGGNMFSRNTCDSQRTMLRYKPKDNTFQRPSRQINSCSDYEEFLCHSILVSCVI